MRYGYRAWLILALTSLVFPSAYAQDGGLGQGTGIPEPGAAAPSLAAVNLDDLSPMLDGLSPNKVGTSLSRLKPETVSRVRGAQDVALYRGVAPSVVLVVTDTGIGSGSVIKGGRILTNWHVVKGFREVGVIYKPRERDAKPRATDVVRANVVKVDAVRDLALLLPASVPEGIKPLELGSLDSLEVGADVYAIGHPSGESWTYTKGIVSQIRSDYKWRAAEDIEHKATVIQTQTPINPGNSGGPLILEDQKVIGVNTFKPSGTENLNFAVSSRDVVSFLNSPESILPNVVQPPPSPKVEAEKRDCKPSVLFSGRNRENTSTIEQISLGCEKWADITFVTPDDPKLPGEALFDRKKRRKADIIVIGPGRPVKWNYSLWDDQADGTFPIIGRHPDGKLKPSSFERRCPNGVPLTNMQCG